MPVMASCRACHHANRDEIDRLLIAATPLRTIAATFQLSLGGLMRHKRHVAEVVKAAAARESPERAIDLLARLEEVVGIAKGLASRAVREGDISTANRCLGTITRCLELLGKARGELLPDGAGVHIHNVHNTVNMVNVRDNDLEIAELVGEATRGFDPAELNRLKLLSENATSKGPA